MRHGGAVVQRANGTAGDTGDVVLALSGEFPEVPLVLVARAVRIGRIALAVSLGEMPRDREVQAHVRERIRQHVLLFGV
jgi:hypothetical protein